MSDSLRARLDDLYAILALGGSPFNSDATNQMIREVADKEIDKVLLAHSLQEQIDRLQWALNDYNMPDTDTAKNIQGFIDDLTEKLEAKKEKT